MRCIGCSICQRKEELSASPLQPVALVTHRPQDSDTSGPAPSGVVASLLPRDLQLHPLVGCIQMLGRKRPPCCNVARRDVSLQP